MWLPKPGSEALVGHFRLHQPGTPLGWPLPSPKGRPASPYRLPLAARTQSPHLSSLPGRHCLLRCLRYINLTTLVKTIWGSPLSNESSKAFSCRARLGSQPQTLDPLLNPGFLWAPASLGEDRHPPTPALLTSASPAGIPQRRQEPAPREAC